MIYSDTDYSYLLPKSQINWLTLNGSFPIIVVKNDYDRQETNKIINSILEEIKKEKNDEFPYFIAYEDQLKINFCIKNKKLFKLLNILIFLMIIVNISNIFLYLIVIYCSRYYFYTYN